MFRARGMRGVLRVSKTTPMLSPGVIVSGTILYFIYESLNGWKLFGLLVLAVFINEIFGYGDKKELRIDPE